nr:MAG TPA: hypothetical protein [Caudoviricetes sp.]
MGASRVVVNVPDISFPSTISTGLGWIRSPLLCSPIIVHSTLSPGPFTSRG